MIRRERKFYSEEFRERVLTAYYNSNESVDMIARRFQVKRDTVSSWVHRKRVASNPKESSKFVVSSIIPMKEEKLPIEAMEERIRELEQQLAKEKMRSTCLDTMIDIYNPQNHPFAIPKRSVSVLSHFSKTKRLFLDKN